MLGNGAENARNITENEGLQCITGGFIKLAQDAVLLDTHTSSPFPGITGLTLPPKPHPG